MLFQFFLDQRFESGAVALVEKVGKDRTTVDAIPVTSTGVEGAVGFAEEVV